MVTRPPARAISLAISAPELPTPTTRTRCATYGSGRLYTTLWTTRPSKRSCPGKRGILGLATIPRSEEHTSELQSLAYLVCRLLLEKKKINMTEKRQRSTEKLT